jgi:hypothetical protein
MGPGMVIVSAQQLDIQKQAGNANARQWALYDGGVQLTVVKNSQDDQWHLRPEFKLQGYLGFPVNFSLPFSVFSMNMEVTRYHTGVSEY